jgi:phosphopantetheinyl transferase
MANRARLGIDGLSSACLGIVLLEMEELLPSEESLLTPREGAKALRLGSRRRKGFSAARAALKRLARQLGLAEQGRPDCTIETLGPDEARPCLGESGLYCSVSHTSRFVVAVAHRSPIGIDVEAVSAKPVRAWSIFMSQAERSLISISGNDGEGIAARAWTIKEAASKALGVDLFEAVREVEVVRIGREESLIRYHGKTYPARHAEGDGHVISLITRDGR